MDKVLTQLVERLTKTYGERLKSVVLYGSAAAGDHDDNFSDYNIFCVLSEVTPRELAESNPIVRWWRDHGNASPLLMSADEARNSTDCFAIEFHDIQERRRVLYGEDVVANIEIDNSFYRAQVEYELRAKLLRLRQKAAGVLDDKNRLRVLLADSVSTFCVLFRHAVRLTGGEAPFEKRQVIESAVQRFGIDPAPFSALLDIREKKIKPREVDPVALFGNYMAQIHRVIDAVDRLDK